VLNSFIAFEANQILNIPRSWRLPEDKTQQDLELGKEWPLFCSIGISSIQGEILRDNPEPSTPRKSLICGRQFGKFKRLNGLKVSCVELLKKYACQTGTKRDQIGF
jgi:hypothetical protein